ncbi:MAG: AAA family ATPase [Erysipelotrichaceae bacterium]|nr:AAA family ATPase [Erysipelotrichaceae bacterium]
MIITILNVKGGVSKTTTTVNLGAGYAKRGKKTLVIDLDGQANLTKILLNKTFTEEENTIVKALSNEANIRDCIYKTNIENLDIIPSNIYLFTVEKNMLLNAGLGIQQFRLKRLLKDLKKEYDAIIIDNNPSLNLCATNSLCACDELIILVNIDIGALDGIKATINHCRDVIEGIDGVQFDYKILVTMINRNNTDKTVIEQLEKVYVGKVYKSKIRYQSLPVKRAGLESRILIDDLKSGVAQDYREFIDEVIKGGSI